MGKLFLAVIFIFNSIVHAEEPCFDYAGIKPLNLKIKSEWEDIKPTLNLIPFDDSITQDLKIFNPDLSFESLVQISEGRSKLFGATGQCTYQDIQGNWHDVVVRPPPQNSALKDLELIHVFTGAHVTPEAAAKVALKECYDHVTKQKGMIQKVRFKELNVSSLDKESMNEFQQILQAQLKEVGFESCFPKKDSNNNMMAIPRYCTAEAKSKFRRIAMRVLKYSGYALVGALVYRVRGGMGSVPNAKSLWFLTATGIGMVEGGRDGAIAGALMFVGTQWRGWGHCFDYGHQNPQARESSKDAVDCGLRMSEVSSFAGNYLGSKGKYNIAPMKVSAMANGEIYRQMWENYDNKGKGVLGNFPTEDAETLVGASAIPMLVGTLNTGKDKKEENFKRLVFPDINFKKNQKPNIILDDEINERDSLALSRMLKN